MSGHVADPAASELSGLALSRSQPQVLWTHNDSGDSARVFALDTDGGLRADVSVTNASNIDWEDIAMGPAPDGGDALYIGDIGDNDEERSTVVVYRAPEPRLASRPPEATAPAQRLRLRYPDSPRNAEALLVDPSTGAIVIVTKESAGTARVYVADRPSSNATTTMRRAGGLSLGADEPVTAGDVSADGSTIGVRTYDRAFFWPRRRGESIGSAMRKPPCAARADLIVEGQSETLALTRDGRAFYTVPEGDRPALRRYAER